MPNKMLQEGRPLKPGRRLSGCIKPEITDVSYTKLTTLPEQQFSQLIAQSEREGFRFLGRLRDEWGSGSNRFAQAGEALFAVHDGQRLIAIGGITRSTPETGRLRRFFVHCEYRRRGVGRMLVSLILEHAQAHYKWVELRSDTAVGHAFYRSLAFASVSDRVDVTHRIKVSHSPNQTLEPTAASVTIPAGS